MIWFKANRKCPSESVDMYAFLLGASCEKVVNQQT